MVAITEPAMAFDGIRSLKGFRKTRTVNPGPMPNHLGRMQSTTAEPRGRRGTYRRIGEKGVSAKVRAVASVSGSRDIGSYRRVRMNLRRHALSPIRRYVPLNGNVCSGKCRIPELHEWFPRVRTGIRTPENRHPRDILS